MKILISDFDKTLFTSAYSENIKAIHEFRKEGNLFVIATGRPLSFLKKDLQNLEVDYYICNDGTTIFDKDFNLLHSEVMDRNVAMSIIEDLIKAKAISDWFINEPKCISKDFNGEINGLLGKPVTSNEIFSKQINEKYKEVFAYNSTNWINIVRRGMSKKIGILKLMELMNFKYEDIITVGDNHNDIEMNEYFESYCVKGSKEELIAVTNHQVEEVHDIIRKK